MQLGCTPLHAAAVNNSIRVLRMLLRQHRVDVEAAATKGAKVRHVLLLALRALQQFIPLAIAGPIIGRVGWRYMSPRCRLLRQCGRRSSSPKRRARETLGQ